MRIQILPLPSVMVGDDMEEPFALIVDQWPHPHGSRPTEASERDSADWGGFAQDCGARSIIATPETVEIVDRHAEPAPETAAPKLVADQRREIARLRTAVTRVIEVPREPHTSEQDGELGHAYTRGWRAHAALVDQALLPGDNAHSHEEQH